MGVDVGGCFGVVIVAAKPDISFSEIVQFQRVPARHHHPHPHINFPVHNQQRIFYILLHHPVPLFRFLRLLISREGVSFAGGGGLWVVGGVGEDGADLCVVDDFLEVGEDLDVAAARCGTWFDDPEVAGAV